LADAVAPGVWWLHETRGSNVFLVEAGDALALVDTGFASSADGIVAEIERVAPGRRLTHVLLTHGHFDHTGAAGELRERLGALVVAGAGDCVLEDGHHVVRVDVGPSHRRRRLLRLVGRARRAPRRLVRELRRLGRPRAPPPPPPEPTPPLRVDVALEGEREITPGLLAVPVPGHTPGSYCFVLPERGVAFVGDLVISHRDGLARSLAFANRDDGAYLDVLRQFAERAPEIGCAGHGPPVVGDFGKQLRALAALPRRSLFDPRQGLRRLRRMRDFSRAISEVRRSR